MNNIRLYSMALTCVALSALFVVSCDKKEDADVLLTEVEAAEIVESSVSGRSAGATMPAVDMTQIVESYLQNCGVPGDTVFQCGNSAGPVTYTYSFELGWLLNCNNLNIPQDAEVSISGNGSFSTQRWAGASASTGNLTLAGLNPQAIEYTVAGTYTQQGSITGNFRNSDPTLNVTTALTLTGLTLRKSDRFITGGTGTAVVTATNGQGQSQTLNGTLVFNGDGTVTVTVNGHTHTFVL